MKAYQLLLRAGGALTLVILLFAAFLAALGDEPKGDLAERVKELVAQLADPDAGKQTAAATALLKLGPDILSLLPAADAKLTPDQEKHLKTIRSTLRDAQAQKDLTPRTVVLQEKGISLSKALAELTRQTGNKVEDRRENKADDPELKLDLNKVSFWQALDAIAKEADVKVSLYERDGVLAVVNGPHVVPVASYNGMFRVIVKRLVAVQDFEGDNHFCNTQLELSWEPRFQPLFLEVKPESLTVQDEKGFELKAPEEQQTGKIPVNQRNGIEAIIRTEAPKRAIGKIGLLKGSLAIIGPSKMLSFTFDKLTSTEPEKGKPAKEEQKQTRDGVTVKIRQFLVEPELWTLGIYLEYPPESADFESFESWLVSNQIQLVSKDGKRRMRENGGYEIDDQSGHQANMTYRFIDDDKTKLGKPEDWKLVYQTPGTVVRIPVEFEFKDLTLP
jgi:hypothetical protein